MPLSVTMALQALEEQVQAEQLAKLDHELQRSIRDDLIRDALDAGVAYKVLTRATGLKRDRLYDIGHTASITTAVQERIALHKQHSQEATLARFTA